jgi:Xaa-Pro dipeptidase
MPNPAPITLAERRARLDRLRTLMDAAGIKAVLLGATASLRYFTGLVWHASERLCGAIVHADGRLEYVCPRFEQEKVAGIVGVPGDILTWEEHENPYALVAGRLGQADRLAVDDQIALFMFLGLRRAMGDEQLADAGPLINRLRRCKSPAEIALMTRAKAITIEVHRRTWQSLAPGVRASEVTRFIDQQHRSLNGGAGSSFCIVSFAEDTSLPHGGETDRALAPGDVVLIDTGTTLDGYNSDITRTYVFGEAGPHVRRIWEIEKEAQGAAFAAAALGRPCETVDDAARAVLVRHGLGPDYLLPGTPHRTGHGIGLDIHEAPNLVRGDATPLEVGMCFSNEPMIVVPGAFGIRLEDHFHMTAEGPKWFTRPQFSLDDPFGDVGDFQP